jgi:hypothetical protein
MSIDGAISNPFRQPLRRKNTTFKTVVWQANDKGKDASAGKTDFGLNAEYVWLAFDFSVPLRWVTSIEDLGPGFAISWRNAIDDTEETAAFCVRTAFGYNRKRRDEIVVKLREAVAAARSRPQPAVVTKAELIATCEFCGELQPAVYEFRWFISVLQYLIDKPDRRVLCRTHAKWRARRLFLSNLVTSNLGFGAFVSPFINLHNVRQARKNEAIGAIEGAIWIALGCAPYAAIAYMLWLTVSFVINF